MWKNLRQQVFINSRYIKISKKQELWLIGKSLLRILLMDHCFYQSIAALPVLALPGAWYYEKERKELIRKERSAVREQFRELLLLLITALKAGYSVENALINSYRDMRDLYGSEGVICIILKETEAAIQNHQSLEELWKSVGADTQIEEVREFAEIYSIAARTGGNMVSVMENTASIIAERIETGKETETLLTAKRSEQNIMSAMPFLLMLYIGLTSPGYFDGMYHNPAGIVIMTAHLLLYITAYIWGVRIVSRVQ